MLYAENVKVGTGLFLFLLKKISTLEFLTNSANWPADSQRVCNLPKSQNKSFSSIAFPPPPSTIIQIIFSFCSLNVHLTALLNHQLFSPSKAMFFVLSASSYERRLSAI